MNVGQIVSSTGRELANVSKHLRQLADAGLLSRSKKGSFVLYRLDDPVVETICELAYESLRKEIDLELKAKRTMLKRARK